ncbi:MAG: AAA family ATPase [Caldilineaceae bacterium SB0668_bin_21]|nr:AAA family ATPase [Caldilineaceae bacterium SB0668_bin_21]MYC19921.1 AAA family ATPase [Caldilineaceae bacterium SB0662_bin_25]
MNERQNGRPQIAAGTEHIQPDPVAAAYDKLKAALADGRDDLEARSILQDALPAAVDAAAPAPTGPDIAEGLRSDNDAARQQAKSRIRQLLNPGPALANVLTDHSPNPPPVSWLVKDWMPDATLSVLTGAGGAGKSRIALQLAVAVATGAERFIQTESGAVMLSGPKAPALLAAGPVVFAAWETRLLAWQNRLAAVCGRGADRAERVRQLTGQLHYVNMRPEGGLWGAAQGAHTSTTGYWLDGGDALLNYAAAARARLLIIDPLAAAFVQNENDRALVRAFLSALDQWAEDHNCAVLIISHPPKGDSAQSGSTDWRNGVQAVWTLETAAVTDKETKKTVSAPSGERILQVDKLNEGAPPNPVYLKFIEGRFAEVEKPPSQNMNPQGRQSDNNDPRRREVTNDV